MLSDLNPLIGNLMSFSKKRLGFRSPPSLFFDDSKENSDCILGKTAHYDPENESITVFIHKRHPKDILRSLSHELVHHCQNQRGDLSQDKIGMMTKNYAQDNQHMRNMEKEAYLEGNMCFRDWEDSLDNKLQYRITVAERKFLKENKNMSVKINKSTLKNLIKKLVSERLEKQTLGEKNNKPKRSPFDPPAGERGPDTSKELQASILKDAAKRVKKDPKKLADEQERLSQMKVFTKKQIASIAPKKNSAVAPTAPKIKEDNKSRVQTPERGKRSLGAAANLVDPKTGLAKPDPDFEKAATGTVRQTPKKRKHTKRNLQSSEEFRAGLKNEDNGAFSDNHYCIHHGGVNHNGSVAMAEAIQHVAPDANGFISHYDMKLADGTILENVAAEDIQVTNASLAEEHKRDDEHKAYKRDYLEETEELEEGEGVKMVPKDKVSDNDKVVVPDGPGDLVGVQKESKIQTPEQEEVLYESRFGKRDEEVFSKLTKLWTK